MGAVVLAIQLYIVLIVVDVLLGWVQLDPRRPPRRWTHLLTEPPQAMLRAMIPPLASRGLDWSPIVLVVLLGALRVWLLLP